MLIKMIKSSPLYKDFETRISYPFCGKASALFSKYKPLFTSKFQRQYPFVTFSNQMTDRHPWQSLKKTPFSLFQWSKFQEMPLFFIFTDLLIKKIPFFLKTKSLPQGWKDTLSLNNHTAISPAGVPPPGFTTPYSTKFPFAYIDVSFKIGKWSQINQLLKKTHPVQTYTQFWRN